METVPEIEPTIKEKPSLTIHIHSWATPIIGFVMLVIGLVAGYLGRPYLASVAVTGTSTPVATGTSAAPAVAQPTSEEQPEIKSLVVAQTRHFIGDETAPITIIEFSDFQ